jgi:hypothetical protein
MKSIFSLFNFSSATLVFAICIKLNIPSCIRAPPLAENKIKGTLVSKDFSIALVIFSPTTEPVLICTRIHYTKSLHYRYNIEEVTVNVSIFLIWEV